MVTIDLLLKRAYSNWDDAEILSRTGRELHDRNRLEHAAEVLARAIELNPEDPEAWAYRSFCRLRGYRAEEGLEILRQGIEATGSEDLRGHLASFTSDDKEREALQAELEKSDTPDVRAGLLLSKAWTGDAEALDAIRRIAREHPKDERVRDNLMWALMGAKGSQKLPDLDLHQEGVPLADAKIEEDPERVSGHWMKAQMLLAEKDWDGLLEVTERALELFPDEETLTYFQGRAFKEKGDLEHAVQSLNRAIGMKPSFAGARSELGKVYEDQGKLELAEEIFRDIPRANPHFPGGSVSLALFLGRRQQWAEAERLFLEVWADLPQWMKGRLKQSPEAAPLLERPAIKTLVEQEEEA